MTRAPGSVPSSGIYAGTVRHRRLTPVTHHFRHRFYQVLLDLGALAELDRELPLFGWNRPALFSFYDRDHLGGRREDLRGQLARWLRRTAGEELPDGPTLLLTQLRVFGYVFDPVSYFYCYDAGGVLRRVVVEVNNTFGERYCYRLADDRSRGPSVFAASARKSLHVSPFIGMDAEYHFRLVPPEDRVAVHIDETQDGVKFFDATFTAERRELTPRALLRCAVGYPLMTLRVVALIHLQAFRLWRKRAPLAPKPQPFDNFLEESA